MDELRERYDRWLYPTSPVVPSHPDHLAVIARLAGLEVAPAASASVLELGCGDGANLIPTAARWPDARFVGVDLAPKQVARGKADIDALGLANVHLQVGDVRELGDVGRHDYVLAVGVLSWVDETTRGALMRVIADSLDDEGVAYVSYNSWPGWHRNQGVRDLLRRHVQGISELSERVAAAAELVDRLRPTWAAQPAMAEALQRIDAGGDAYLLHEFLAPHNTAFWHDEVVELAGSVGLHVLGTASIPDHAEPGHEQHRAYADQRSADAVVLSKRPRVAVHPTEVVRGLRATADLQPQDGGFRASSGATVQVPNAATLRALTELSVRFPEAVEVDALLHEAGPQATAVLDDLTLLVFSGLLGLHNEPARVQPAVPERPLASALSRLQAGRQAWVTDALHRKLLIRPDQAELLQRLDGQTTVEQLTDALARDVGPTLKNFARNGLLVPA